MPEVDHVQPTDWSGIGGRRQPAVRARSTGVAYIKVHESEIADDYPEPAQYSAEEEEMDELVLFGEEDDYGAVAPDPDWLPRKTLQDFSVYNAEVCPHTDLLRLLSSFLFWLLGGRRPDCRAGVKGSCVPCQERGCITHADLTSATPCNPLASYLGLGAVSRSLLSQVMLRFVTRQLVVFNIYPANSLSTQI